MSGISNEANSLRERGNERFRNSSYIEAHPDYSAAIKILVPTPGGGVYSSTTPPAHHLLLSRLYHNRALTKTKMSGSESNEEALVDVRRATELDPAYLRAWALCAQLLANPALRDQSRVAEAPEATHRVMELELWHVEALDTMRELVGWELASLLEEAPPSDKVVELDFATAWKKLYETLDDVELNRLLMQFIIRFFRIQENRSISPAAGMAEIYAVPELCMYFALVGIFRKMVNFRMGLSFAFLFY